ncbi:MAG: sugar kinase [Planctomycetaceae bacterium]|nr:sugar kinase [Planctomycetaceae bacterium]
MGFVTFGEVMMRMAPRGHLRLSQVLPGELQVTFAGAEANVAASLSMLGATSRFVTALPDNPLADSCLTTLRGLGVDTASVRREPGRLGIYFVETGANQRPGRVIYDRSGSSISLTAADAYNWQEILGGQSALHVTGITPALSESAAEATLVACQTARKLGLQVSCDLNFRAKLWNWRADVPKKQLAAETMSRILPFVDVLIANEADCGDVLSIHAGSSNVESGQVDVAAYPDVARQVAERFPNLKQVATTLRESHSASHNSWGAMLFDVKSDTPHFAPVVDDRYQPYEIVNIVDRVGGGDAFAAGLLLALHDSSLSEPAAAVRFAAAASCLAHSVSGDFNFSSRAEVEALMGGATSGRVVR